MRTIHTLLLALLLTAATLRAQEPLINLVVNAGSGFRGAAIAQGSVFQIWGWELGPPQFQFASLPLPTTAGLAGTSVTISINGTTVTAPIYFTGRGQMGAVMPSNTPVGDGTLTLTYNGKSASSPIQVVRATFGISHTDVRDTDNGSVIRSVAAATFPDYEYVSDTNTAKPGDTVTIWGTGLGPTPNNGGDTNVAPAADVGSAPLVFVGGVQSPSVTYWGRSPNTGPGLDQINFVIPPNAPLGCNVSVVVQTATPVAASNAPTIAIAATHGATCSDLTQRVSPSVFSKAGLKTMFIGVQQSVSVSTNSEGRPTTTSHGRATVLLFQTTEAVTAATNEWVNSELSLGSCSNGSWPSFPAGVGIPSLAAKVLEAGTSISLTPPSGNALVLSAPLGPGYYQSGDLATALPGGTWSFSNGAGGVGIGPVTFTFPVPPAVTWTNQAAVSGSPIVRTDPLTIRWSGGDSNSYVRISGSAGPIFFQCAAPAAAGQFTVPSSILLSLPIVAGGNGSIEVSTVAFPFSVGAAPGFDLVVDTSTFATNVPVIFR